MSLPATLQSRGAGSRARRWAGTQLSILFKCICATASSHSPRHSCFLGHPVALAVSVCVRMHMKRFRVLKMEISVLNFKWFTDKLKQMERKKREQRGSDVHIPGPTSTSLPWGSHSPALLYSKLRLHLSCQLTGSISDRRCLTKEEK